MSLKLVMFDLDGTLLPMDQDLFIKTYFGRLVGSIAPHGYEPKELASVIWRGTEVMITNDGGLTNEQAFWQVFSEAYPGRAESDMPLFDSFYENEFDGVCELFDYSRASVQIIDEIKSLGLRTVLATNPVFPRIATEKRAARAGLSLSDFEIVTTYENSRYSKPSLEYYRDILSKVGLDAKDCLMVGNDVDDDMVAKEIGMKVFLLTDCLINKKEADISIYPCGGFDSLSEYIRCAINES